MCVCVRACACVRACVCACVCVCVCVSERQTDRQTETEIDREGNRLRREEKRKSLFTKRERERVVLCFFFFLSLNHLVDEMLLRKCYDNGMRSLLPFTRLTIVSAIALCRRKLWACAPEPLKLM